MSEESTVFVRVKLNLDVKTYNVHVGLQVLFLLETESGFTALIVLPA